MNQMHKEDEVAKKSKRMAVDLENFARDFEISIDRLRAEAREKALTDARCEAAAANQLADRNMDIAQMLREAVAHIWVLEELRNAVRDDKSSEKLRDVVEAYDFMRCVECGAYHMKGRICFKCGNDQ